MRADLKAVEIVSERGKKGLELERLYRLLRNQDLFLTAYSNLYANDGAMTPGVNPNDSIDGMRIEYINSIIKLLEDGNYQWTPNRRVYIPKSKGGYRPLGMPGWTDKLVQEAMRILLEAYYEPQFYPNSHGFRPSKGCHTALRSIAESWRGTAWFIEGDIKGCFDNIDHETLLKIMGNKIKDNRFLRLTREMLQAGYMENWKYNSSLSGTPQGGVISPLLANIYLNELDKFVVEKLMPKYNKHPERRKKNPEHNRLSYRLRQAKQAKDEKEVRRILKLRDEVPFFAEEEGMRRLKYLRYADDFLLGFKGPKQEAEEIKTELRNFLLTELKLELSEEKTLITHAQTQPARFLGYEVSICNETSRKTKTALGTARILTVRPVLRIPKDVIEKWKQKVSKGGQTTARRELEDYSDYDIIKTYDTQFRGLVNYYLMALNVGNLYQVKSLWKHSLILTLAGKHKTRTTNIYRKYHYLTQDGLKAIRIVIQREGKQPLTATFGTQVIHYQRLGNIIDGKTENFHPKRTQLITRLQAEECELCTSKENVEVHHIRKLKDWYEKSKGKERPDWLKRMMEIKRKTLVVCRNCHLKIHAGQYDGKSLHR